MVFLHLPNIAATAKFSACRKYRYCLTLVNTSRTKGKTVCVIMQNPSVADEKMADKSVQFLEKLVFEKGLPEFHEVSRCFIVNHFGKIQTRNFQGEPEDIGPENDQNLIEAIEEAHIILIAWGKNNPYSERKEFILELVKSDPKKKVLMTKKHPSRGHYRDFIVPLFP